MLAKMALFKNYQKTATYYTWLERYLLIQSHCIILSSVYYVGVSVSHSRTWNPEPGADSRTWNREPTAGSRTWNPEPTAGSRTWNPEPTAGSRTWEPGTHCGFPYLGTRNPLRVPIPGNPEPTAGSRTWEPGTRYGFPYLGTQNPELVPVPGNPDLGEGFGVSAFPFPTVPFYRNGNVSYIMFSTTFSIY